MLHNGAQTYNYPAIQIVAHDPIPLTAGWNMIGGYENTPLVSGLTTTPANLIVTGTVYGWTGTYANPTNLIPGFGYWVLSTGNGVINSPTVADGSAKLVAQDDKSEWGKDNNHRCIRKELHLIFSKWRSKPRSISNASITTNRNV